MTEAMAAHVIPLQTAPQRVNGINTRKMPQRTRTLRDKSVERAVSIVTSPTAQSVINKKSTVALCRIARIIPSVR